MWEMCEVMAKVLLLGGLFLIAWFDYKTQLIKTGWLLGLGAIGMACTLLKGSASWNVGTFAGISIGIAMLLFAWVSKESIGFGDGWLFVVTGVFLGFSQNVALLFGSMLLAGAFAIVCLLFKRKGRNDRMALAPFVLTAYVVFVL